MPSDTPKEPKLQIQSKKDEEPPRSILTKGPSSPPPTLNQDSNIVHPQPKHFPNTASSQVQPQTQSTSTPSNQSATIKLSPQLSTSLETRETVMAGGAYLKEKQESSDTTKPIVTTTNTVSPTTTNPLIDKNKNDSLSNIDYTLNPPKENQHHKAPSVHAHFYVEETLRPVRNRSRSGSASNNATSLSPTASPQHGENPVFHKDAIKSQESIRATSVSSVGSTQSTPHSIVASAPSSGVTGTTTVAPPPLPAAATGINTGAGEQNANTDPRLPQDDGKFHVLLGVCGALSVAKVKLIVNKLFEIYTPEKISIQVILTKASENFILPETLSILENIKKVRIWTDIDEWTTWKIRLDPVLHIELRRWADILVVCPMTANTLSKITLGICDNLLTNVIRAWNTAFPILLAPAMDSHSYSSSTTKRQLRLIADDMPWIEVLKPLEKVFGSFGDIGMGGMMDWNEIVNKIVMKLGGYPEVPDEEDEDESKDNIDDSAIVDDDDDDDEEEDATDDVTVKENVKTS